MRKDKTQKSKIFSYCVDSIHNGVAKLLPESETKDETTLLLPANLLPDGAKEGSWLKITIELDKETEQKMKQSVADLYDTIIHRR